METTRDWRSRLIDTGWWYVVWTVVVLIMPAAILLVGGFSHVMWGIFAIVVMSTSKILEWRWWKKVLTDEARLRMDVNKLIVQAMQSSAKTRQAATELGAAIEKGQGDTERLKRALSNFVSLSDTGLDTLQDSLATVQERLDALTQRRGPGRPFGSISAGPVVIKPRLEDEIPFLQRAKRALERDDGSFAELCRAHEISESTVRDRLKRYRDLIDRN